VSSLDENNRGQQKEQKMISSKQFEAYHIMLWTIRCIKVTRVKNGDKKLFYVQCHTKTYQHGNAGLRERHPTMFKEDTFSFTLIDESLCRRSLHYVWTCVESLARFDAVHLSPCIGVNHQMFPGLVFYCV